MSDMLFYAPEFSALGKSYEQLLNRRKSIEGSDIPDVEKLKLLSQIDLEIDDMSYSLGCVSEAIDNMIMMETVGGTQ